MPGFTFPSVGPLGLGSPPSRPSNCFGHRYYDPLRLPLLRLRSLRISLDPGYLAFSFFRSCRFPGGGDHPSAPGRFCIPVCLSRCTPQGDDGPLKFPGYPCMHMPRSSIPVVSPSLALSFQGLQPSGVLKPSAFPGLRPVIPMDHNQYLFGTRSRGLRTCYTWLHTHPCGICTQVRYRFGG